MYAQHHEVVRPVGWTPRDGQPLEAFMGPVLAARIERQRSEALVARSAQEAWASVAASMYALESELAQSVHALALVRAQLEQYGVPVCAASPSGLVCRRPAGTARGKTLGCCRGPSRATSAS